RFGQSCAYLPIPRRSRGVHVVSPNRGAGREMRGEAGLAWGLFMGYVAPPVARKSMVPESNDIIAADSSKTADRPQTSPRAEDAATAEPIARNEKPSSS